MGTKDLHADLGATLFGRTRRALLALLFGHADEAFYLRQIVRALGIGHGTVQRELQQLSSAGIVSRSVRGRQVYFQANPDCPIFRGLKDIVTKTAGVADIIRAALVPLADHISLAFVYGSVARGTERRGSDLDLLVLGEVEFGEVVGALRPAQDTLGREINPTVYPQEEFRAKLKAGHHFLSSVVSGEKIFIMGDERELGRLAQKRVARRT